MRRIERQIIRLNHQLERLRRELELVEGELGMHRHLHDDATRDALVTDEPADRAEARDAAKDVARLQAARESTHRQISNLERKRDDLLDRLGPA